MFLFLLVSFFSCVTQQEPIRQPSTSQKPKETSSKPIKEKPNYPKDQIVPEKFGAQAYYKPLDGRQYEGFDFPLINFYPLSKAEFEKLNTGLKYNDYPKGVTKIVAVQNNKTGITIPEVFTKEDIGKSFVGLKNHLNGAHGQFTDEYIDYDISARYAKVIYQASEYCLVDFEFNGGDRDVSKPQENGQGYIFFDNTKALAKSFQEWQNPISPDKILLKEISRSGYVLTAYVAPQLGTFNIGNSSKNFLIHTGSENPGRIKFGIEDYNGIKIRAGIGNSKYQQPNYLFRFSGYKNHCVSHNVEWVPAHNHFEIADPYIKGVGTGNLGGGGVFMVLNINPKVEWNELTKGNNITKKELFMFSTGNIGNSGSTKVDKHLTDVDKFGFVAFIGKADFSGPNCLGQTGGKTAGGVYYILDDFTVNYSPVNRFTPTTETFMARFSEDYSGINSQLENDGELIKSLANRCLEITSENGNFWKTRRMGGSNRALVIHTEKFVFLGNTTRFNSIHGYWTPCYNNNGQKLLKDKQGMLFGSNTVTSKKMILNFEILSTKEDDGSNPKLVSISRDYLAGNSIANKQFISTIGLPFINSIRTHINWTTVFQKPSNLLSEDELTYINKIDRKPKEWQVNDKFRICAWVELESIDGIRIGDIIKGDQSNVTAVVRDIDDFMYSKRLILGSASGNFKVDQTVNNGKSKVIKASNFDPTVVYTCARKQRGDYSSSQKKSVKSKNGKTYNYYGGEYPDGMPGTENFNAHSYQYSYLLVTPNLPLIINGNDKDNPVFEIEVVHSEAEILLDGKARPTRISYLGKNKFKTSLSQVNAEKLMRKANSGYGISYMGVKDDNFSEFDSQNWVKWGKASNLSYTRAEMTWYLRNPENWQNSPYRKTLKNAGNNSAMRPAGKTAYKEDNLAKWSKGYTIINVTGIRRIGEVEKGSSGKQFERQRGVYKNNPVYNPAYAEREQMLPKNEQGPYRPKFRVYGQQAVEYYKKQTIEYEDPSGTNVVFDQNVENAPDLPYTIRKILDELGYKE
jgi:hypothetical protein